jgi:hypothetical protein
MTIGGLKRKYFEVFGAESRFNQKQLFRRVAWRIQFSESVALPSSHSLICLDGTLLGSA